MKLHNILIAGMSALALASCSDYLEVDAPSKLDPEYVFSDKTEIDRALNGVYATMLTNNTFGQNLISTFCLNSDVDFKINNNHYNTQNAYQRFDCDPAGGELESAWPELYAGVERANKFIVTLEGADIYAPDEEGDRDKDLTQQMGEAKVLRAIFYHELTWMFGDVPVSWVSTDMATNFIYPIMDRTQMLQYLIDDLKEASEGMKFARDISVGVERVSKEMAWAMIARLALTAGGYSLRPEGGNYGTMKRPENYLSFYQTAREYANKVIESNTHALNKPFYKVFVDECNFVVDNADDPIFEIPFGQNSSGRIGYIHGPKMDASEGSTPHAWGEANSGAQLNALYRYHFDNSDIRRDYINQLISYSNLGVPQVNRGRSNFNGKWSKLWNNTGLGATTQGDTGINYPYMRYTDVLLMFAEADNEINNGPSADAIRALETVRTRAFAQTDPSKISRSELYGSKEDFLKAVLDERKFEFAGENMRWRDLVRNNLYNINTYYNFFRYFGVAEESDGSSEYLRYVSTYDFGHDAGYEDIAFAVYFTDVKKRTVIASEVYPVHQFPNQSVEVVEIVNPLYAINPSEVSGRKDLASLPAEFYSWYNADKGVPADYFLYSLRGYIYCDEDNGLIYINNNGNYESCPEPSSMPTVESLPAVRYILPYPRSVVERSNNMYTNKYGY